MDLCTVDRFRRVVVRVNRPRTEDVTLMTDSERAAYQHISAGNSLLELEEIPHVYCLAQVTNVMWAN